MNEIAAPDPLDAVLAGVSQAVPDSNIAIDFLLGFGAHFDRARRFLERCDGLGVTLVAPAFWALEVDTTLRQLVLRGQLDAAELPGALARADAFPISLIYHAGEWNTAQKRAREIAHNLNQPSVYDAFYLALALGRNAPFWTADERFFRAASQMQRQDDGTLAPRQPGVFWIGGYDPTS